MVKPTSRNIAPVAKAHQQNELCIHLYLHKTYVGPHANQSEIKDPKLPNAFGWSVVNDWALCNGVGRNAEVIARAQGLHIQAGMRTRSWYNSFSIEFKDDSLWKRFKQSTLQVMGPVVENGEWAIVGGTGEFLLAQGIIYSKILDQRSDGHIMELDIHALYFPVENGSNCWSLGE